MSAESTSRATTCTQADSRLWAGYQNQAVGAAGGWVSATGVKGSGAGTRWVPCHHEIVDGETVAGAGVPGARLLKDARSDEVAEET